MLRAALLVCAGIAAAAKPPPVTPADVDAVRAEIRRPGARAVLVNVWASWCDPCRAEMPAILRAYREQRARGLRLVLVSADDDRAAAARFLASLGVDFPSFQKTGDDMAFIDGLDPRWTGTLPASLLFDGAGRAVRLWEREVTHDELTAEAGKLLDGKPTNATRRQP